MKWLFKVVSPLVFLFSFAYESHAQDIAFTQFYAVPYQLNPALTGAIDASYQVGMIYRDQWRGALEDPLTTIAFGGEVKFDLNFRKKRGLTDRAGVSLFFLSDKVSIYDFNTNQIAISTAFHKLLSEKTNQYLSIGTQMSIFQKNINFDQLNFGDEFNNLDGYTFPSNEPFPPNNFGFVDLSIGLNYTVKPTDATKIYAGAALHHLLKPNISFYAKEDNIDPTIFTDYKYDQRFAGHISVDQKIREYTTLQPRILFQTQGPNQQYKLGANIKQDFTGHKNGVYFGAWLNLVDNFDGLGLHSVSPMVGFQTGSFVLGFSYDVNLDQTLKGTSGLNSFELSIRFLGDYYNDDGFCPVF